VFPAFLLPFLALGLLTGPWNQARTVQEGFLIAACVPFLVFLTFRIWPRYLLPMTPVLLLWTGRGWLVAEAWLRRRPDRPAGDRPEFSSPGQQGRTETRGWAAVAQSRIRNTLKGGECLSLALPQEHFQQQQANRAISGLSRLRWVVRQWAWLVPSVLICFPLAVILVAKPLKAERLVQYPVEYKEAGKWMKAHLPADALILARKPEIAYYAGRLMHPLPNEDLIRVLGYARKKGIGYLVVDDYFIAPRPQLRFLLASDEFPADLALLHEARAPNGRKVRVFAIRSDTPGGAADGGQDPSK
jgi:hypothetical protein